MSTEVQLADLITHSSNQASLDPADTLRTANLTEMVDTLSTTAPTQHSLQLLPALSVHGNSSLIPLQVIHSNKNTTIKTISITKIPTVHSQQATNEYSIESSESSSDSDAEKNIKDASSLRLQNLTTTQRNSDLCSIKTAEHHHSVDDEIAIPTLTEIRIEPQRPTTIKSTSIGAEDEDSEEDDYQNTKTDIASQLDIDSQCIQIRRDINNRYIKYKWRKLLRNSMFWSRILTLFLTLILLTVAMTYCIAQTCEVELDLITECGEPKTREEIWEHSELISLKSDNPGLLTQETQHGLTDDSCWTTKKIEILNKNPSTEYLKNHSQVQHPIYHVTHPTH